MNFLQESIARFAKLEMRDRLLLVILSSVLLFLVANLALLKPQQTKIASLRQSDGANRKELASINKTLAILEEDAAKGTDPGSINRATVNALKTRIAEANAFLGKAGTNTDTAIQLGTLVKELLNVNPEVTLLSLKTLPVTPFLSPNIDANKSAGNNDKKPSLGAFEIQKTIYKHGVEVRVKGNYMALLTYMENLQEYSKHLFWSEARLDASDNSPEDAILMLTLYSLSEQSASPLR